MSPIGTNYSNKTKLVIECTRCGNLKNKYNDGPFIKTIFSIRNQDRDGCPKCSKVQTPTKEQFETILKESNPRLELIGKYNATIQLKEKIKIKCHNCEEIHPGSLDRIRTNNGSISCSCSKSAWWHFEELVREVYGGSKKDIGNREVDCFIDNKENSIIIEAKFGHLSLTSRGNNSKSISKQANDYINSGFQVFYVVNCSRNKIRNFSPKKGITYLFQDDFDKLPINSRVFNKSQLKSALDIYKNPSQYSSMRNSAEYEHLKKELKKIIIQNNYVFPTIGTLAAGLNCSFQKIADAFGISDKGVSKVEKIRSCIEVQLGKKIYSKKELSYNLELKRIEILLENRSIRGQILDVVFVKRKTHYLFKCDIHEHYFYQKKDLFLVHKSWHCIFCSPEKARVLSSID